jgi:hypothetical protein
MYYFSIQEYRICSSEPASRGITTSVSKSTGYALQNLQVDELCTTSVFKSTGYALQNLPVEELLLQYPRVQDMLFRTCQYRNYYFSIPEYRICSSEPASRGIMYYFSI